MDRGHYGTDAGDLAAVTYADPGAMVFRGRKELKLVARICCECGFVEMYAPDAAIIWDELHP